MKGCQRIGCSVKLSSISCKIKVLVFSGTHVVDPVQTLLWKLIKISSTSALTPQ